MTKHTPTPWKLVEYSGWKKTSDNGNPVWHGRIEAPIKVNERSNRIFSTSAFGIYGRSFKEAKANAHFICKAVNSYEELVKVLKSILEDLESGWIANLSKKAEKNYNEHIQRIKCALNLIEGGRDERR